MYRLVKIKSIIAVGGAFKIEDYNGNSDFFPKSTVHEQGTNIYIKCWILEKKSITYSFKNKYYLKNGIIKKYEKYEVEVITPKKVIFDPNQKPDESLIK